MIVRAELSFSSVRVYMGDVLHLDFRRADYVALQAWRYAGYWAIEIYCKGCAPILAEYEREETWLSVLEELGKLKLSGV